MTDTSTTGQVDHFLHALDRALRGLPRARRRETVSEIRAHIDAALADAERAGTPRSAAVRQVLSRLGSPADIAAAAVSEEPQSPRRGPGVRDATTAVVLLIGGVFVPIVGWFVGLVLLWTSRTWRVGDKLIGTLVVPGGLLPALYLLTFAASPGDSTCRQGVPLLPGGRTSPGAVHCTSGGSGSPALALTLLAICLIGPLFTFGWLLFQAARRRGSVGVSTGD